MMGVTSEEEKNVELSRTFRQLAADAVPALIRLSTNIPLVFLLVGEGLFSCYQGSLAYNNKVYALLFK